MTTKKGPATAIPPGWVRVVFSSQCDEEGNCPVCKIDYADCKCPGPTQDEEFEYQEFGDELYAKPLTRRKAS